MELVIVPVAHVSKKSVEKVRETVLNEKPDAIAVELCEARLHAMLAKKTSFRGNDAVRNPLYFIFYLIQRMLGEIFRVKPGSEMFEAVKLASELQIPLYLVDRDINRTMQRLNTISIKEKLMLVFQSPFSIPFFIFKMPRNLEELMARQNIERIMEEFKARFPSFYRVLVEERDAHMAARVSEISAEKVVLVVGAGHVKGIASLMGDVLVRVA
ncbi:TraB/GumN family protein [Candidatus Micrarchaeota archaeon]|nr:TraB/GumN family protein [Candidatus Micrarchaeota archaeon]